MARMTDIKLIERESGQTEINISSNEPFEGALVFERKFLPDPQVAGLECVIKNQRDDIAKAQRDVATLKRALVEARKKPARRR